MNRERQEGHMKATLKNNLGAQKFQKTIKSDTPPKEPTWQFKVTIV